MRLREFSKPVATAVMTFGRMNPITTGHKKLVNKMTEMSGDSLIFLTHGQKPKTDPLTFESKVKFAEAFFPGVIVGNKNVRTIIEALQAVEKMGYTDLVYVAGSDRVESFTTLINKYNGKEYNFESITVVSAGERDANSDGTTGMSASKMRAAAAAGDIQTFTEGVPNVQYAQEMFNAVRKGMEII